jgi:hypothetical protein
VVVSAICASLSRQRLGRRAPEHQIFDALDRIAGADQALARALLGDEMADQLNFPKLSTFGVLPFFRLRARTDRLMRKWIPGQEGRRRAGQYSHMLGMSYDDKGPISYRLPAKLHGLPPATFSGGEQQRVNLARGFAPGYPVLLLDEPTASLDAANRAIVIALINEAKAQGTAIIGIFHDAEVREAVADRLFEVLPIQDAA